VKGCLKEDSISSLDFSIGDEIASSFRVNEVIQGGTEVVYLCEDLTEKIPVALKTVHFHAFDDWREVLQGFIREAKIWIQLGQRRNLVSVYRIVNVETDQGLCPLVVTELVKGHPEFGTSLAGWIRHSGLDMQLIVLFSFEICIGMMEAQKAIRESGRGTDLIHCDLNPENILISAEGDVKIADFGMARIFGPSGVLTFPLLSSARFNTFGCTNARWGTPPYMSPEQCSGDSLTIRSDIYSFGCTLYEMCTGRHIFDAASSEEFIDRHVHKPHIPVLARNSKIPRGVASLIEHCLQKDPLKRPSDFSAVKDLIDKLITEAHYPLLIFDLCGFSGLSNEPRVKKSWDVSRETEIWLLDAIRGPDYVVKQGLARDVEEVAAVVDNIRNRKDGENAEEVKEKRLKKAYESLLVGDSFFKLSETEESMEPGRQEELLRLALSQYVMAQEIAPGDPRTGFRLGMTYNMLAHLVREEKRQLSDGFLALARQEYTDIIESNIAPFGDEIGNTYYFSPYHVWYHRAATYFTEDNVTKAAEEWRSLLCLIDRDFNTALPNWQKVLRLIKRDVEHVLEVAKECLPTPDENE
jgi:serine/threonine protein kinase